MEFEQDDDEFSMSSYDGEQGDSLVIKPPQAVILKKDKRDKRDRRDRHRHKGSHKERHKSSRDHRSREERREHRRHRDRDGSRRDSRKHDKRREKSSKHELRPDELRAKLDRERKFNEKEERRRLEREEIYVDERGYEIRARDHSRHADKKFDERDYYDIHDYELSPRRKAEKEQLHHFLQAEKQKQLSQKEADARRQKREEEKKEEMRIEELRQRAEASMYRRAKRPSSSPAAAEKKFKFAHSAEMPETVELISDDEMDESGEIDEEREPGQINDEDEEEAHDEEDLTTHESSPESEDNSAGESESSSGSSSEEDEQDDDATPKGDGKSPASAGRKSVERSVSGSSSEEEAEDDTSDEKDKQSDSEVVPIEPPKEVKEILPSYFPATMGCRSVDEFECLNRIEEGTYGVVYRAREKSTKEIVALKRLKMEKEKEGFPITSLREVNTLLKGQHENIVTVREIVVGSNMDKIYIVMDYVEHDLKSLMETMRQKNQEFAIGEVKTLMKQLLQAVHHLHDNWILHRDLKTSNLLLSHRGILKVGDFGLAREYGSPLKQYTPIVVTLWYRAPELLLGTKQYSCAIDVWSVGCIFGELLGMEPMFAGKSEVDQVNRIFKELGTPNDKIWPGFTQLPMVKKITFNHQPYNNLRARFRSRLSDEGFSLLNRFLTYHPEKRISCAEGLEHPYFVHETPIPIDPAMFPTWPAKSENPNGRLKKSSPKPPSGGKIFKDLGDGEDENIAGFYLGGVPQGAGFQLKF